MKDKKEQIPEYLLRFMVLRFLDSQYPAQVEYKKLEKEMEAIKCSPRRLARVLAYLKEKGFIEGVTTESFGDQYHVWLAVKITAEGIDYLEQLEEEIRLEVEKKEKEIGFEAYRYRQEQEKKNE